MDMNEIEKLSADMLTSPIKSVRLKAEERLRFLSSYNSWEEVKGMLPICSTNYSRFIVCKAMRFVVSNELGPSERREAERIVLEFLRDARLRNIELPVFVRNELYSICASAIYIDWKVSEMSTERKTDEFIGGSIIEKFSEYLSMPEVLECVLELMTYFMREYAKTTFLQMRDSLMRDTLPCFFRLAVGEISRFTRLALELACAVLEAVPRLVPRTFSATDPVVFLQSGEGWFPHITVAASNCGEALLREPQMELAGLCARFLRVASGVACVDQLWFDSHIALTEFFFDLSEKLLQQHRQTGLSATLHLACAILVNVSERDGGRVTSYFRKQPGLIASWAIAARFVLEQWIDGEEDIRQELLHLFFLFSDRLIPYSAANAEDGAEDYDWHTSTDLSSALATELSNGRPGKSMIEIAQVVLVYFDSLISKAHLTEDAQELRTDEGVILHNEKTLLPLAEMLLCRNFNFHSVIMNRLTTTVEQYDLAVRARKSNRSDGLGDLMLSLAIDTDSLSAVFRVENIPHAMMHVCLSRLSVLVSIVAISILNGTAGKIEEILDVLVRFTRELLSVEDALTAALLESLSLLDDDSTNDAGFAKKNSDSQAMLSEGIGHDSNYSANIHNSATNEDGNSGGNAPRVHIGMIRSLFFFCSCVCEIHEEWYEEFYDILFRLLRFVYLHCDDTILTNDANFVLSKILVDGVRGAFLSTDALLEVLAAVRDDRVALLRAGSAELTAAATRARAGLVTSLTFYAESRHYGGYGAADAVPRLIARLVAPARLFADPLPPLRDLSAVADGAHQPATLLWLLEGLAAGRAALLELVAALTAAAPIVIEICAKACALAAQMLREDCMCELRVEVASLTVHAVHKFMLSLCVPPSCGPSLLVFDEADGELFSFLQDAEDESVLYNIADIICALFEGNWCSVGVLFHYEKVVVTRVLYGYVQLFLSKPVYILMSCVSRRTRILHALQNCLSAPGSLGKSLFAALDSRQLWQPVLEHLVKCLRYVFLPETVVTIEALIFILRKFNNASFLVDKGAISKTFSELIILIATSPSMDSISIEKVFNVLKTCYVFYPEVCLEQLEELLQSCSAYHRVRVRVIGTIVRSNKTDMVTDFVSLFGTGSKVETLAAW